MRVIINEQKIGIAFQHDIFEGTMVPRKVLLSLRDNHGSH